MQYSNEKFKQLCLERDTLDPEDSIRTREIWDTLVKLILENEESFQTFLQYMRTDMTGDEYGTLSEISDDIAFEHPSWDFIDAYRILEKKYPEETKRWKISSFIDDAEYIAFSQISARQKKGSSMQYSNEKFKQLCVEFDALNLKDHIAASEICEEMKQLILESEESFQIFLRYMRTDMMQDEYRILSEISDSLVIRRPSWDFIDAYRILERRYPEEAKKLKRASFIIDSERFVRRHIGKREEKGDNRHEVQ